MANIDDVDPDVPPGEYRAATICTGPARRKYRKK
jgi:hypothetical protein